MYKILTFLFVTAVVVAGCTPQATNTQSSSIKNTKAEAQQPSLPDKVEVDVVDKGFHEADIYSGEFEDYITMTFAFTNKTDKPIKGVQGRIKFYDIFDNLIFQTSVSYDKGVPAQDTANWEASLEYNQFIDDHQKLKDTALENMKFEWVPEIIIYEDGTKDEI